MFEHLFEHPRNKKDGKIPSLRSMMKRGKRLVYPDGQMAEGDDAGLLGAVAFRENGGFGDDVRAGLFHNQPHRLKS